MIKCSKRKIYIVFIIIVLFLIIISYTGYRYFNKVNIDKVLETISYSYLPKEAKAYVKKVYEETGKVILTEKNKKENLPYLNPKYVIYLSLSDEEKKEVYDVPLTYSIDYEYENNNSIMFPETYDIRNINGKSYITPMQNQGNLGLCWAFSTIEQIESYLMYKNQTPYNENTERFSVRQMDYATSNDGILNYENENGYRSLTTGGNFYVSSSIMSNGLSLIPNDYMEYNEKTDKKYLEDILNYNLSKYEVDSTLFIPNISESATAEQFNDYINLIKSYILEYGSAYVGTESPNATCASLNKNDTYLIRVDNSCILNSGHAMQIIGWDDNYEYQYCKEGYYHNNNLSSCSKENLVTGKGAWLLKNSWGTSDFYKKYQYVYLAYDSLDSSIAFTTSLSSMEDRIWDNNYHENFLSDNAGYTNIWDSVTFEKKAIKEKIEKVKFMSFAITGSFNVTVKTNNEKYENIKTIEVLFPGIYTIDLTDKNIIVTDDSFEVIITGNNNSNLIVGSISVFTSNIESKYLIETEDIKISTKYDAEENENYEFFVYSKTKNINSNELVEYSLLDGETDLSNYLKIVNETEKNRVRVAKNDINAHIIIDSKIGGGTYTLKTKYKDYESSSTIVLGDLLNVKGLGNEDSPYIITNEKELKMMSSYPNSHFALSNDITLTKTWTPIGTLETPFNGVFDGNNYTISNLSIENDSYGGLFGVVSGNLTKTEIKNITIKNINIKAEDTSGGLIGKVITKYLSSTYNGKKGLVKIDNIRLINGENVSKKNAGSLVGEITLYNNDSIYINNIVTSVNVSGKYSSGLIGTINSNEENIYNINISNILNTGNIVLNDNVDEENVGLLIGSLNNSILNINNFIITGNLVNSDNEDYSALIGKFNNEDIINSSTIKDGYYINGTRVFTSINDKYPQYQNNILKKDATELKNVDLYKDWNKFNDYWEIPVIDDITRIPVLKNTDFDYTKVMDIKLNVDSSFDLTNFITPEISISNIKYEVADDSIVGIENNIITGINIGNTTIHIISNYDGYEKDINVVVESKLHPEVTFNSNDENNHEKVMITNKDENFILEENTFIKNGYKFVSWNTKKDGTGISYNNKEEMTSLMEDMILYAIWEPISYKIVYNYNDEFTNIIKEVKYEEEITIINNGFEKLSYSFKEWNTKSDGSGTSYKEKEIISNLTIVDNDTINLYAIWDKTSRVIKFNSNGADGIMNDFVFKYEEDLTIPEVSFTKNGYKFKEWNTKEDSTGTSYLNLCKTSEISGNEDLTLYAIWEPIKYKIYFDANYGDFSNVEQTFFYDTKQELLKNSYTKEGYKFVSWNTKKDGTGDNYSENQEIINLTNENNDVIFLFAIWSPIRYEIKFDSNGGIGSVNSLIGTYDEEIKLSINSFVKDGYKFREWNTKSDGSGTSYKENTITKNLTIKDSITLYAIWEENFEYIINKYNHDKESNLIDSVDANTNLSDFIKNIKLGKSCDIKIDLGNKSFIYTGSKTKIYKNDNLIAELTNIVRGDINGDGKISSLDYVKVKNHIMKTNIIKGDIYLKSADANLDNKISSLDYVRIKNIIMKGAN